MTTINILLNSQILSHLISIKKEIDHACTGRSTATCESTILDNLRYK